MSPLPTSAWTELSLDFHGPLPTGEYLLVLIDDYSRFPVVEIINSVSAATVLPVLDKLFSLFGIPVTLKTDNGPPFNGSHFAEFAAYLGFTHRRITPIWPQANGEAERFMRTLGKAMLTAIAEKKSWKQELFRFLRSYRATPHCSTKTSPGDLLFAAGFRTRFPTLHPTKDVARNNDDVAENDYKAKAQAKAYADTRRRAQPHTLQIGDLVYVRQMRRNKMTLPYDASPYTITQIRGTMITARRGQQNITRNASFFKPAIHGQLSPESRDAADNDFYDDIPLSPTPLQHDIDDHRNEPPPSPQTGAQHQPLAQPQQSPPPIANQAPGLQHIPIRRYPLRDNRRPSTCLRDFITN
jgi:hypothetical protein